MNLIFTTLKIFIFDVIFKEGGGGGDEGGGITLIKFY